LIVNLRPINSKLLKYLILNGDDRLLNYFITLFSTFHLFQSIKSIVLFDRDEFVPYLVVWIFGRIFGIIWAFIGLRRSLFIFFLKKMGKNLKNTIKHYKRL
jgi:hypothetical protein